MIIICNYLNSRIGEYSPIRVFVIIQWLFVNIEVIWSEKSSNNWHFIWWLLDWLFAADNPNNQKSENKMWIPRPFWQRFNTWQQLLFDLLMIIWWLFDDYLIIICIIVIICYIEMWTRTTHPFSHSPGYAASQYRRTGLHVQWR